MKAQRRQSMLACPGRTTCASSSLTSLAAFDFESAARASQQERTGHATKQRQRERELREVARERRGPICADGLQGRGRGDEAEKNANALEQVELGAARSSQNRTLFALGDATQLRIYEQPPSVEDR